MLVKSRQYFDFFFKEIMSNMAKALFVREFEYTRFNIPDEDFFLVSVVFMIAFSLQQFGRPN